MNTFFDRLKAGASVVADATKRTTEELQLKRKLAQVYDEIGQKTVELVEAGQVSNPELTALAQQVAEIRREFDALDQPAADDTSTTPAA